MKNKIIIMFIIIFMIISVVSIYSSSFILSTDYKNLYIKQIIWYLIGFIFILLIYRNKNGFFYKYDKLLYIIGNVLLILVLIFGTKTNGAKAWFTIPGIGSFQPSEFMKIFLIISLAKELDKYKDYERNFKNELLIIVKCFILVLIPTILTFFEPDTGNVLIYLIILVVMLFIYGIRYRWFISIILITGIIIITFLYLYINKKEVFVNMFGTNFFYRMDRLLEWKNKEGMQLENALAATGSAPPNGYGIGKTPIYFPEAQTDFIISIFMSNFGYKISIIFIIITLIFDMLLIKVINNKNQIDKYLISGIMAILIFQQIQNIGMNLGLLPITGITLPFISYGGSSLISYMILIGLVLNINKERTS